MVAREVGQVCAPTNMISLNTLYTRVHLAKHTNSFIVIGAHFISMTAMMHITQGV